MNNFSTKLDIRIDWSEMDLLGHINNVAIAKYVQSARVNYLESIGLMQMQAETKFGPILASTACQFRRPLYYPGRITIYSKVEYIKNTSFKIRHLLCDEENRIAAEAQDIIVFFNFENNSKRPLPEGIKEKIKELESRAAFCCDAFFAHHQRV